jgi:hypothetical protein
MVRTGFMDADSEPPQWSAASSAARRGATAVLPSFRVGAQFFALDVMSGLNHRDDGTAPRGHLIYRWYAH